MRWLSLFVGVLLFASSNPEETTDIVPRAINFLIFVGILWYLIGEKVVKFFEDRKTSIAKRFQEIEDKLNQSKQQKEAIKKELEDAKKMAQEIIDTAKKEAEIISNKIKENVNEEIAFMKKHFEEFKQTEIKKAKQEAIKSFLKDVLKDIHLSTNDAIKLVLKANK